MTLRGFPSVSAAERHLLAAGWSECGDGTFWHGRAVAHVLGGGDSWSVLIMRQDVGRAPRETHA
jgi:hypothetical protein